MGSGSIGIKLADNKFFPIMDDSAEGSKTLELTTVSKNQESVQIHLYRSKNLSLVQTIYDAEYIGTLIMEDVAKKPAGAPTIKLKITLNADELLSAEAQDMDTGARQSLIVSLKDLSRKTPSSAPGFDLAGIDTKDLNISSLDDESIEGASDEAFADTPIGAIAHAEIDSRNSSLGLDSSAHPPNPAGTEPQEPFAHKSAHDSATEPVKEKKRLRIPAWLCALILVVGISLLAAALIFAWRLFSDHSAASRMASSQEAQNPAPSANAAFEPSHFEEEAHSAAVAQEDAEPTPPPVWQDDAAAVAVAEPEPPSPPEPAQAAQNVYYLIRWGDTLWDLAETFYRNPWRYSYIARYNGIRNPNLIVAGTYLVIPAE